MFSLLINITAFAENKVITPSEEAEYFEMLASDVVDVYQFEMDEYTLEAILDGEFEYGVGADDATMAVYLNYIFFCISLWCAHQRYQNFVNCVAPGVAYGAVVDSVALAICKLGSLVPCEELVRYGYGICAAYSDD